MDNAELLIECKAGLDIQADSTNFDSVLMQKLLAVKSYIKRAGVSEETMNDDLAVGVIVMGVSDLWNANTGEIKFSPVFHTLLCQLSFDNILTLLSNPAAGAENIAVTVQPTLTFSKQISDYDISIVNYDTQNSLSITVSLDITKKILKLKPSNNLDAATKYAIVINSVTASSGEKMDYKILDFTTI